LGRDSDKRTHRCKTQCVAAVLDTPNLKGRLKDLRAPSRGGALNFSQLSYYLAFYGIILSFHIPLTMSRYRDIISMKGVNQMPVLSRFYGIVIRMYFLQKEHNPPHIHAIYGDDVAAITIADGAILEGSLPYKALELVREWISINRDELLNIWQTQDFRQLPPLE